MNSGFENPRGNNSQAKSPANKKKYLLIFVVSLIVFCVVTVAVTYVFVADYYTQKYADYVYQDPNETESGDSSDGPSSTDNTDVPVRDGIDFEKIDELDSIFSEYSYYDIDYDEVLAGALRGYASGTVDKYTEYYTAEEFARLLDESRGEMQGIGINVIFNTEYSVIEVLNVMPDSPALAAGVEPGDFIVAVGIGEDAESVSELGYTRAVEKLQGYAGTICEFTVKRGKNFEETIEFSIERGYVHSQSVMSRIYDKDKSIGIIKILEFDGTTVEQFSAALDTLRAEGAEKFVFDVRNNPGGDLNVICAILDMLLPEGPIIRIVDKAGNGTSIDSEASELTFPMAVLCNDNTASAAELFTSALMDYDKAESFGITTYGKGSMQSIIPLSDGCGLRLTTKMYFPPYSEGYDGIGITPDNVVDLSEEAKEINIYKLPDNMDAQLLAAVEYLKTVEIVETEDIPEGNVEAAEAE